MKYIKLFLLFFVFSLFGIVVYYGFTEGFYYLFISPLLIVCAFLGYYLHKKIEEDTIARIERGAHYATEEINAEKWMHETFVPDTLSFIKSKRWIVIIYSFLFIGVGIFLWSYLSFGLMVAIRVFAYGIFLFSVFLIYVLTAPDIFDKLWIHFKIKKYLGDWERAYFFLLPISFLIYILYPLDNVSKNFIPHLINFPVFFLVYTFLFLAIYSLTYIYEDIRKEEDKELEKTIKQFIDDESNKK